MIQTPRRLLLPIAIAIATGVGGYLLGRGQNAAGHSAETARTGGAECVDAHGSPAGHAEGGKSGGAEEFRVPEAAQSLIQLTTEQVRMEPFFRNLALSGTIAFDAPRVVPVNAPVGGTHEACRLVLGERVAAGQALCRVRPAGGGEPLPLRAPVAGFVLSVQGREESPSVESGALLHSLGVDEVLEAFFDVPESELVQLRPRQVFAVRALTYPGIDFTAVLSFISPRVDETSRTLKVRAQIDNARGLLRYGMSVTAELPGEALGDLLVVPEKSLQAIGGDWVVLVKKRPETFAAVPVKRVAVSGRRAAVAGALSAGAAVVVDGAPYLFAEWQKSEIVDACKH
jgi:multidrug efflux pump subunit AcrA (membrane-fusion protein)